MPDRIPDRNSYEEPEARFVRIASSLQRRDHVLPLLGDRAYVGIRGDLLWTCRPIFLPWIVAVMERTADCRAQKRLEQRETEVAIAKLKNQQRIAR